MHERVEIENVDHEVRLRDRDRAETPRTREEAMRDAFVDRASARASVREMGGRARRGIHVTRFRAKIET